MTNNLICWRENNVKKWDMIKDSDTNTILLKLMKNRNVDNNTIFIVPTNGFIQGIWLFPDTHKSKRVDFYNFYDDFGIVYEKPKADEESKMIIESINENKNTKYGWISPAGKYFHCDYQGHSDLADKICFGMIDTLNAERYLEESGWCKIYKPLFKGSYSVYVGGKHTITANQMKTLIEMQLDNADGVSDMLNKEDM